MKTRLQEFRKRAGFKSAKAFAEEIGLSPNTYTNYEQGKVSLTLEKAWEFADIFACSLDELAGRKRPLKQYSDQRQVDLNSNYEALTDEGKDAALGAVRGIRASESARANEEGPANSEQVSA